MPFPFASFPNDSAGVDNFAHPLYVPAKRDPTAQDNSYPIGTFWGNESTLPASIFQYVGGATGWEAGGNPPATTSTYGIVLLTDNNEPVATQFYVDAAILGVTVGAVAKATEASLGIIQEATDAQAVAGTNLNPGTPLAVQPKNLAAVFAAPPATGGTTPAAGKFTTLEATGLFTGDASATIDTAGTALNLATDNSADAVNIGTVAARVITIGNVTGATGVTINSGTAGFAVNTTGAGDVVVTSADTVLIDSAGVLELNSSAGIISVGNDAVSQNINVGTAGARTITIGNSTGATSVIVSSGTGNIDIGQNAIAHVIRIGNITGATGIQMLVGSGNFSLDGVTNSTYTIGTSTTSGTITIGGSAQTGDVTLVSSTAANSVLIQNGINVGAQITSINNGATAANSTVNILSGAGSAGAGLLHMADNARVTTISLGNVAPAAARTTTILGGNQAQNDTMNILSGAATANTQTFAVLSGVGSGTHVKVLNLANTTMSAGTATVNIMSAAATGGTLAVNIVGDGATTTAVTTKISTGAAAHILTIGNAASGAQTWNVGTGNLAFVGGGNTISIAGDVATNTINIGTGAAAANNINIGGTGANVIRIGDTQTTGSISIGNALTSGTINVGSAVGTGTITIGKATNATGQTISIASGTSNAGANIVNILNGVTPGASTTLNIMNGAATAGTQTVNILATGATRAGAVNIGTGVAAHAITLGQVTSTIAVNGPQTNTLASGAATALTVVTSAGTGRGIDITSSGVTVPDLLSNVGGLKVTPTDVAAGASPLTANNRHFKVVFNTVSIAASADQALVIQNSTITGANTDIMFTWFGTTTGSAVSLKSVVNAAGQSTLTFTNGAGATTSTSNITVIGWVMN